MNTLLERLLSDSKEGKREFVRQDLLVSVSDQIWEMLEKEEITSAELAARLGTTPSNVSQMLSGRRNLTLKTLADISFELGYTPEIQIRKNEEAVVAKAPATIKYKIDSNQSLSDNFDMPKFEFEKFEPANEHKYLVMEIA